MAGIDIERALQDHRQAQVARADGAAERAERYRDIRERAKTAGNLAKRLTDITGFSEADGIQRTIYDTRISAPISLGKIEREPGKHGFAKIIVNYGLDSVERSVKGLFFTHTEIDRVPNDSVQEITIAYFAGNEAASELENIAYFHWSIASGETEDAIAGVEGGLKQLCEVLDYRPDTIEE